METLSSQVLEFEGKARANPIGVPFYFLGKLLMLPANVRLDWKVIARYKHSSLLGLVISEEGKQAIGMSKEVNCIEPSSLTVSVPRSVSCLSFAQIFQTKNLHFPCHSMTKDLVSML